MANSGILRVASKAIEKVLTLVLQECKTPNSGISRDASKVIQECETPNSGISRDASKAIHFCLNLEHAASVAIFSDGFLSFLTVLAATAATFHLGLAYIV